MSSQPFTNYQVSGGYPSVVGGTGTTPKFFPAPSNQIGVTGTVPSATSAVGQLNVPGRNILNGIPFNIRASGNFEVGSGGACPAVTIDVVANTSTVLTSPTYTVLMTSGAITAQSLTGTWYDWFFDGKVQGSNGSGTLQGLYSAVIDGTVVRNNVVITNMLSGLFFGPTPAQQQASNQNQTDPVFGLLVRVTFSVSETGNSANLFQFEIA